MSDEGEKTLKNKFNHLVKNDFRVLADVVGQELVHQKKVRIDFMLYPNPHLVEAGFDPVWFGVEVKHFGISGETGKMSRFLWQCVTYAQSVFQVDHTAVRPAFVLGLSDVYEVNQGNNDFCREYRSQLTGMLRLAGLAHVGTFSEVLPTSHKPLGGWNIFFSSSSYFRRVDGKYEKMKYNVFKENVGNCSS
jgi:hypothetical protein